MKSPDKSAFRRVWPRCFIIFMGVIEVLAAIVLILTELGNVAAHFWYTNVFAGGWCGLIMLVHFIGLFVAGCCSPGPPAAFRAVVITFIALVACATLISFDAVFIALPTTCILTPQCTTYANSTTMFSYYFQISFYSTFNTLGPFKTYTQTQAKFLFQTVQLGVGSLCFVLCLIYLIIYYVTKNKASKQVGPAVQQQDYCAPQPDYRQQQHQGPSHPPQHQGSAYRPPPPRAPQAAPGEQPWSTHKKY